MILEDSTLHLTAATPSPSAQPMRGMMLEDSTLNLTAQPMNFTDEISSQIPKLQQTEWTDIKLLYEAVLKDKLLTPAVIDLGSNELKKLAPLQHLCRVDNHTLQIRLQQNNRIIWVAICPYNLRSLLIEKTHTKHHSGINRTYKRIKTTAYWPGMTGDITKAIKSCNVCQAAEHSSNPTNNNRQRLFSGRPLGLVSCDLVGLMCTTPRGNKMILVVSDHFTRRRDAIPIPDGTAETVATALNQRVLNILGLPDKILGSHQVKDHLLPSTMAMA